MKKERKFHAKTKSIQWKPFTKDVVSNIGSTDVKRIVTNPELLPEEDLELLEYDPLQNVYCKFFL